MAGELQLPYLTGQTIYFLIRNSTGSIYNGSTFESYDTGNYATYDIAATEQGTASGYYTATFPVISAGIYNVVAKVQAGASPAETDFNAGEGDVQWTGTAVVPLSGGVVLAATGLDNISVADPGGVASTFAQMVVQVWRRFFKRVTLTSTTLITYADDNSTARTTQTVSDDNTTQVQGPAS